MTEKELTLKFADYVSDFFDASVDKTRCDCNSCRFDIILTCRTTKAKFIVEMKKAGRKRGSPMGQHINQAARYRLHKIDGICYPVLVAPGYSYDQIRAVLGIHPVDKKYSIDIHSDDDIHHSFNGLLGQFGVGEIRKRNFSPEPYYHFIFNNLELYSCNRNKHGATGLNHVNYQYILNRLNSWPLSHTFEILQTMNHTWCPSIKPSTASVTEPSKTP